MHKLTYATGGSCGCEATPAPAPPSAGITAFLEALLAGLTRHVPPARRGVSPCEMSRHLARDIGWDC